MPSKYSDEPATNKAVSFLTPLHCNSSKCDHITPPITLVESSTTNRLQADHSGLQMSSWPGTVIPRWRTSSSSVKVSKASDFRFVLWTVYSPYPTVNLRWPSFSSRHCMDLEQSSTAYHICSITSRLLLSLEDIFLLSLLLVITVVMPAKWLSFTDTSIALNYCRATGSGPDPPQLWSSFISILGNTSNIIIELRPCQYYFLQSEVYIHKRDNTNTCVYNFCIHCSLLGYILVVNCFAYNCQLHSTDCNNFIM